MPSARHVALTMTRLAVVASAALAIASAGLGCAGATESGPAGMAARSGFVTLPPGSRLPSGPSCAARVRRNAWEPRAENAAANHTTGVRLMIHTRHWAGFPRWRRLARRVDGQFIGTTDEILQWASCKWGFDEDLTRAQAVVESHWSQRFTGDHGLSVGLMQIKSAAPGTPHRYTWPYSRASSAYNVDYALAWRRACYEGMFAQGGWLPRRSRGHLWDCVGLWSSGLWRRGAAGYVRTVRRTLRDRPWVGWGWPGR
jgi:hypothetical protein